MAIFGGENSYPLSITAAEAFGAIHRGRNIDVDLARTVRYTSGTLPPALSTTVVPPTDGTLYSAPPLLETRDGDVWVNPSSAVSSANLSLTTKKYKAAVIDNAGTPTLLWIEE